MATFKINLYPAEFRHEEHAIYDELQTYLNSFMQRIITIPNFQYLKPIDSLTRTIKISLDQAYYAEGLAYEYTYCSLTNMETGNKMYYYITDIKWVSSGTAELSLELDYMNTYRNYVKFTDNTHITRKFKDRWRKNTAFGVTTLAAKIDQYPENITSPSMILTSKREITKDPDLQWHLVYYTDYSADDISKAPLKVGLFPDKAFDLADEYVEVHTFYPSDFQSGIWYYFTQQNVTLERVTSTGITQTIDLSKGYWAFKLVSKSAGNPVLQFAFSNSADGKMTTADVDFISMKLEGEFWSTTTSTSATQPTWDQLTNTKETQYSGYTNHVKTIMSFSDWYEENKTNSLVSKIIAIPYLPFNITIDSTITFDPTVLTPVNYKDTLGFFSPVDYTSDWKISLPRQSADIITADSSELSYENAYNLDFETKIYHSDYHTVKYAYGNDFYVLKLEDVDMSNLWIKSGGTLIDYYLGKTVTSALAFHVRGNQADTTDYEGWIISNQDLSVATFSNEYLNYVKYGQYYDEKALQISALSSIAQAGTGIASRVIGSALGGFNVGGLIGVGTSVVTAGVSIGASIAAARNNLEAKIANYKSQSSSISTTNSIDIFTAYQGNRLLRLEYEPRPELKEAIQDYFRLYGYATDEYGQMTDSRYWNDYFVADVEFSKDTLVSNLMKEAIRQQYSNGVRIYHWHNKYDLNKELENEETSLI